MRMLLRTSVVLAVLTLSANASADTTPQPLPFTQDWSNAGLITMPNIWTGVPGIVGYSGAGMSPSMILLPGGMALNVIANQTATTLSTGGVAEFDGLPDHVVALQGSGTADAPQLVITVQTTGSTNIRITYNLRDIDGSNADNSVQSVYLQYRVGMSGNYTDVPAGFVMDATTGPMLATLVTPVSAMLPAACDNQPVVQIRILTLDAVGADEWVGVDDISISAVPLACGNGAIDAGEACDTGAANGTTTCGCTTSCRFAASGTMCAPAGAGPCDAADTCDGTGACAARVAATTVVCRPSAGTCDPAESCDGVATTCPTNVISPSTTECRPAAGVCDVHETCDGTSAACPTNAFAADTTPCNDGLFCNGRDTCLAGACTHASSNVCVDTNACTVDTCAEGTAAASCMNVRTAAPACCSAMADCDDSDVCTSDSCTGVGGVCAYDPVPNCCNDASACNDSDPCTADACDTSAHHCTHTTTCVDAGALDSGSTGIDAAIPRDGSAPTDSSTTSDGSAADAAHGIDSGHATPRAAGCACTAVGARSSGDAALSLFALGLAWIARRRATRSRPESSVERTRHNCVGPASRALLSRSSSR